MATSVSGSVSSKTNFLYQNSQSFNDITFTGNPGKTYDKAFTSTDITKCFFNQYSVTTSPTTVNVQSLTNVFGTALSFATIKHIQVINEDATNSLTVGGGTLALFSTLPVLTASSCVNLTTSITVSGSALNIQLVSSAGTVTTDLLIVGT